MPPEPAFAGPSFAADFAEQFAPLGFAEEVPLLADVGAIAENAVRNTAEKVKG